MLVLSNLPGRAVVESMFCVMTYCLLNVWVCFYCSLAAIEPDSTEWAEKKTNIWWRTLGFRVVFRHHYSRERDYLPNWGRYSTPNNLSVFFNGWIPTSLLLLWSLRSVAPLSSATDLPVSSRLTKILVHRVHSAQHLHRFLNVPCTRRVYREDLLDDDSCLLHV